MGALQRRAITRSLIRQAQMTGHAKRPRKKLPRQQYPRQIENAYAVALSTAFGVALRRAFAALLRALPDLLSRAAQRRRIDADEGDEARALITSANASLDRFSVDDIATRFALQTSAYNRTQLGRQLEAGIGVNVLGPDPTNHNIIGAFVDSNTALIQGLSDKTAADVSSVVFRAIQDGKDFSAISQDLQDRFAIADRRSQLIARDQVGKLYGQINVMRQKQLGVTSFVWQTMGDERVRDEHAERDGQEYEYDDPPDGELPGEPIMCRCWAEPVLDDLDDSDDEESDDDESTGTEPEPEQVLDPEESTSTLNLVDNPGLNPALESLLADDTAAQQAEAEASEGVGLGRIGVSSEIAGEEELGIAEGEAEQGVGLGRIGVSSEIAGEETAAAAAVEPAVAAPAAVIAPTTPTEKVLMPSTAAAPMGYASYTYDGETYYQHSVGGGAFLTGPQLVQYEAGNTVTLTGPNQQYQGFDALARKGMPTRYQFQEWIGQHKPMFSADDIKSGKANDDILWLIGHEHAKPTLVQRINRLLGGR